MIPLQLYIGGALLAGVAALGWAALDQHDKLVVCREDLQTQAEEIGKLGELEVLRAQLAAAENRERTLKAMREQDEAALAAVRQTERRLRSTVAALESERLQDVSVDAALPQSLVDRMRRLQASTDTPPG